MMTLVTDPDMSSQLIEERQRRGIDHHDEVWEGVYIMPPMANDEHQRYVCDLATALNTWFGVPGLADVRPGVNLASDATDWTHDYRVPDVVVFLKDSSAKCHGAFWTGGPDLAIEVVSPGDRSREKLDFYANVGTHELLIVDRDPWQIELFRLVDGKMQSVGISTVEKSSTFASQMLPLTWQLVDGDVRPIIALTNHETGQAWEI